MSRGHNIRPFTEPRKLPKFRGGDYVAELMAELNRAEICRRIGLAQEQSGLTQLELADLLHVHVNTIQNWSSPKKAIVPWDRLDEYATATGVTRAWLLHGDAGIRPGQDLSRVLELLEVQERLLADLSAKVDQLRRESSESA